MRYFRVGLFLVCLFWCGCGSSSDSFVFTQSTPTSTTGSVQVDHTLFRTVTTFVSSYRFTGLDQNDGVLYGPVDAAKTSRTVLEDVPVEVVRLRIEYLSSEGVVIGRFETEVEVVPGETLEIDDPGWLDTPPAVPGFADPITQLVGTNPVSIAAGDFDGDGDQDVAVANSGSDNISILIGQGDGAFNAPSQISTGTRPSHITVCDFNRDGHADLAVANFGGLLDTGSFSVLPGVGDGTFGAPVDLTVQDNPIASAAGDFDGDGDFDLAVANYESTSVSLLHGNGDGTFDPTVNVTVGTRPHDIQLGDFNRDGQVDLAVANEAAGGTGDLSILLGNGDGTFQPDVRVATGQNPRVAAVADLNGDTLPDVVTANFSTNDVSVLLGRGDGTFAAAVNYPTGMVPLCVVIDDFNHDGRPDLALATSVPGNAAILPGNGDGTFATRTDIRAGDNSFYLVNADFNNDGLPDLAVANFGLTGDGDISTLLGTDL